MVPRESEPHITSSQFSMRIDSLELQGFEIF